MEIMTTVSDLRTWVNDRIGDCCDSEVAAVVDAIRQDAKCPPWGADWTEYLSSLPELLNDLTKTRLGDLGTGHVWFTSVGQPTGCDLAAEDGEPLSLPGESESDWLDLEGAINGNRWEWDGNGKPIDFNGNTVTRIVAFV